MGSNEFEEKRKDFLECIKNFSLIEFKNYLDNGIKKESSGYTIALNIYNTLDFNSFLSDVIKLDISIEKIQLLIQYSKYNDALNKDYIDIDEYIDEDENEIIYHPLFIAIKLNKYKVADLLINNGADINKISYIYLNELDNSKSIYYILKKGLKVNTALLCFLIENKKNKFIKIILKNYIYDNKFILKLLSYYKGQCSLSRKEFYQLIYNENNKLLLDSVIYSVANEYDNSIAIDLLNKYSNMSKRKKVLEYIQQNKLKELKNFLKLTNTSLSDINHQYDMNNDLLFISILHHVSHKILDFIIQECHYDCLNYSVCINEQNLPLLFALLYIYDFKSFDYLIKKGADINHPKSNKDYDYRRIISILYENESYQCKTLKYIFNSSFTLNNTLICQWVNKNQITLLQNILKIYRFNNKFILMLLSMFKNQTAISNIQWYHMIHQEKQKCMFNKEVYESIVEINNYRALQLIYDMDVRGKDIINSELFSIFHYNNEINEDMKKYLFIRKINRNEIVLDVTTQYLDSLYESEKIKIKILSYIKSNNIVKLKKKLDEYQVSLTYFRTNDFDILMYAIEKNVNFETIEYITTQYESLDFSILTSDNKKIYNSPLSKAISSRNFKLASYFLKSGASIHYKINGKDIISKFFYENILDPKILRFAIKNGFDLNDEIITKLRYHPTYDYLNIIFEYYIIETTHIVTLILISRHRIPLSNNEFNEILNKKGSHLNIKINYNWFYNVFSKYNSRNLLLTYLNFSRYHPTSIKLSENEMYEIVEEAINRNELVFLNQFINSSLFDYNQFHLEAFLSEKYLTGYKIKENINSFMYLLDMIMDHSSFDFNKTNFNKIFINLFELGSFQLLNHFVDKFFYFDTFNTKIIDIKIILSLPIVDEITIDFISIFIEKLTDHPTFDFKIHSFDNILSYIIRNLLINFYNISKEPELINNSIDHLIERIIHSSFKNKSFNWKDIDIEKNVHDLSQIKSYYSSIIFYFNKLFCLKDFTVNLFNVNNVVTYIATLYCQEKYFIIDHLLDLFFSHKSFTINNYDRIRDIINLATKIKLLTPTDILDTNKNDKLSDKLIKLLLKNKAFKFNKTNIEAVLISLCRLTYAIDNNNNNNNNPSIIIENITNKIFKSKTFQKCSFDINEIDEKRILLMANRYQNLFMIKWIFEHVLIQKNLDPIHFRKLLLQSSKIDNKESMKYLIEKIFQISENDNTSKSSISLSLLLKLQDMSTSYLTLIVNIFIKLGYFNIIKKLIENKYSIKNLDINAKDENGDYPLIVIFNYTVYNNDYLNLFRYLLKHNACINISDINGTPLFILALKRKNYSILNVMFKYQYSIENDKYINKTNKNIPNIITSIYNNQVEIINNEIENQTLLNYYHSYKYTTTDKDIYNIISNFTPLILSYLLYRNEIFKLLVEYLDKETLTELDRNGYNVMHYAIFKNDYKTVVYLLDKSFDINFGRNSHSVLDISIYLKDNMLFKYFLNKSKMKLYNKCNSIGDSLGNTIIKMKNYSVMEKTEWLKHLLLQKKDYNINLRDKWGKTVLFYACQLRLKPLIKFLVKHGAELNEYENVSEFKNKNKNLRSTLSYVIELCDISIIKYIGKNYPKKFTSDIMKSIIQENKNYQLVKTLIPEFIDVNTDNLLKYAIKSNDTRIVKYLLDSGINICNNYEFRIIKSLFIQNNLEIIKLFIPKYYNIKCVDKYNNMKNTEIIHYAIDMGNGAVIDYLLKQNMSKHHLTYFPLYKLKFFIRNNDIGLSTEYIKNDSNFNHSHLIIDAIFTENITTIQYVMDFVNIDLNSTINYDSIVGSPLNIAITQGNMDVVQYFIEKGADINYKDEKGYTPLMSAIKNHNFSIINYLLEKKVDINTVTDIDERTYTPLSYTVSLKNDNYYINHLDKYQSLIYLLVNAGANVNDKTIIEYCIKNKDEEFLNYFLERNVTTNASLIPLVFENGDETMIKKIINNKDIMTSGLFYAIKKDNEEMIKYLIENGANLNDVNSFGDTPFICAMKFGNQKIIEYLLQHGALLDTDYPDHSPESLLQKYKNNDYEFLQYIITRGKKFIRNENLANYPWNNTPLILSMKSRNSEIIKIALQDVFDKNSDVQYNDLMSIIRNNNENIISDVLIDFLNKDDSIDTNKKLTFYYAYKHKDIEYLERLYKQKNNCISNIRIVIESSIMNKNIMKAYYSVDNVKNNYKGNECIDKAVSINNLELLQYLYDHNFHHTGIIAYNTVIKNGNIEMFEYLDKQDPDIHRNCYQEVLERVNIKYNCNDEKIHIYYKIKKLLDKIFSRNIQ